MSTCKIVTPTWGPLFLMIANFHKKSHEEPPLQNGAIRRRGGGRVADGGDAPGAVDTARRGCFGAMYGGLGYLLIPSKQRGPRVNDMYNLAINKGVRT